VLKAVCALEPDDVIRGQFAGYLDEPGVAPGSTTETFAAVKLSIESWRWAGVPWYVRFGKSLPVTSLQAIVRFQRPPRMLFHEDEHQPHHNEIVFRLSGEDGVSLMVQAKQPGEEMITHQIGLDVNFGTALGARQEPYERLIGDAIDGNPSRFARVDMVEEAWRVVDAALANPGPVHPYAPGSWGPDGAVALTDWQDPR
jgi:glucose-6-phosphate 1-dehydrogenase